MNYRIHIVQPLNYPHSACFIELAELLKHALRDLGHETSFGALATEHTNIILGYHLLDENVQLPPDSIVYQLEQIADIDVQNDLQFSHRLKLLRQAAMVWEYDPANAAVLVERGISYRLVPIGYHPSAQTFEMRPVEERKIDVLFFGSLNERRKRILVELSEQGARVQHLFNVYGTARDEIVARAKLVLNMHYYEAQLTEQTRLAHLVNNGVCVVTETAAQRLQDCDFEGLIHAPYDRLVERCMWYLDNALENKAAMRDEAAATALEAFKKRPMVEYVKRALGL